jgi:predicted secreted acid phosphatase
MRRLFRFLLDLAREIGDESAYQRYLTANGAAHSSKQWRTFSEARMRSKYSRAKCC